MKKEFKIFFYVIFLPIALYSQKIQSIKVTYREAKSNFGNYIPGAIIWYDANGNTKNYMSIYDKDGNEIEHRDYNFNTEYNSKSHAEDTVAFYVYNKRIDSNQREQESIIGRSDNTLGASKSTKAWIFYKYGKNDYQEINTYLDKPDNLISKVVIVKNDTLNNATTETAYSGDGNLQSIKIVQIEYDSTRKDSTVWRFDSQKELTDHYSHRVVKYNKLSSIFNHYGWVTSKLDTIAYLKQYNAEYHTYYNSFHDLKIRLLVYKRDGQGGGVIDSSDFQGHYWSDIGYYSESDHYTLDSNIYIILSKQFGYAIGSIRSN